MLVDIIKPKPPDQWCGTLFAKVQKLQSRVLHACTINYTKTALQWMKQNTIGIKYHKGGAQETDKPYLHVWTECDTRLLVCPSVWKPFVRTQWSHWGQWTTSLLQCDYSSNSNQYINNCRQRWMYLTSRLTCWHIKINGSYGDNTSAQEYIHGCGDVLGRWLVGNIVN